MKRLLLLSAILAISAAAAAQEPYSPSNRVRILRDGLYGFTDDKGRECIAPQFDYAYPFIDSLDMAIVFHGGEEFAIDTCGNRIDMHVRMPKFRGGYIERYEDNVREGIRFLSTAEYERMRNERVHGLVTIGAKGYAASFVCETSSEGAEDKVRFAVRHAPRWSAARVAYEYCPFSFPLDIDFSTLPLNLTTFYPIDSDGMRIDVDFEAPQFRGKDIYAFYHEWIFKKKNYYIKNREDYYRARTDTIKFAFTIDEKGRVCDVEILSYKNDVCRDMLLQALAKSPRWKPAEIDGKPVRCRYSKCFVTYRFR